MSNPQFYAKVENGVVTDVHFVAWDFLVANPERYGNPDLWLEAFYDNSGRGYCSQGYTYDVETDKFVAPPQPEPFEA